MNGCGGASDRDERTATTIPRSKAGSDSYPIPAHVGTTMGQPQPWTPAWFKEVRDV